ncbi:Ig-like domain-containing protein [Pseudonocardia yunnanensis]|uniref:Ig-like domain-containing protein n=1 Tax=Pseudonocardia yunnanensis TaxID=58107 RepID=A0ABW4EVT3_9PSEU
MNSTTTVQASPSSATVGQEVVLTATVTCPGFPPQGGLGVTFFDGANLLDTVPVNASGQASLTTTFTTQGAHEITAAYNGNGNCGASNATTTVQVTSQPDPPTPPTPPTPCMCGGGSGLVNIHNSGNNGGWVFG